MFCLTNLGFVQCFSLASCKLFPRLCFVLFSRCLLCVLCLTNFVFVHCFSLTSCNFVAGLFYFLRQILLRVLCFSSNCLCSISKFPRLRLNVYVPLFFPLYYLVKCFVMRAFPRELRFLFPAPLICTLYLLFVILFW